MINDKGKEKKEMQNFNSLNDFTKLKIWQDSHQLMLDVNKLCKKLPPEELYNLSAQTRRSSLSVPANIAEGCGRYYYQENIAFCRKARGSLDETKSHLYAIRDLNFADKKACDDLIKRYNSLRMMLNGYIRFLKNKKPE